MASYTWSDPGGGTWSDAGNWTPNGIPGSADQALINLSGAYAVSLDIAEIGSLTLDAAGVMVAPTGTLKLDGVLDVKAGTLTVDHAIQGGTLIADGGTITYAGGVLDGVTLQGPLDLSVAGASVTIDDGITFAGGGPAQIMVTGSNSSLVFNNEDTQTLDNVAITVGNASGTARLSAGALTLDANSSLSIIDGTTETFGFRNLDNLGTISIIDGDAFQFQNLTNTGTVNIEGAYLDLDYGSTGSGVTNAGTIVLSDGANLTTGYNGFSNTGTIIVESKSTLNIDASATLAQLGTIVADGGNVRFSGTLDLAGNTIDISAGSPLNSGFVLDGTIQGGTIDTDGTGVQYGQLAFLSGVTIDGTLGVNGGAGMELDIENGLGFTGTGPGRIVETAANSFLHFLGNQTLDDVDVTLGNSDIDDSGTLTLGPSSTVTLVGNESFYTPVQDPPFGYGYNDILDNKGTIVAASGGLYSYSSSVSGITSNLLQNDGLFAASGGTMSSLYQMTNTGTLDISGAASVTVQMLNNSGIVDISGGGSLTVTAAIGDKQHIGQLDSTGTVRISDHGTLTLEDGAQELGTVSFLDGTGTVVLEDLYLFKPIGTGPTDGTLNMFQSGDALTFESSSSIASGGPLSLSHEGNTLEILEGGAVLDTFALTGQDYTDATFAFTGQGIVTDAPCFCAGTLILTDRGECPVEELEVGDFVITLEDGIETVSPVRWLGRRHVVVAHHPEPEHVDPIRIARDAVAPGVPVRDLFVSPDHALHVDGMLIQARQLVNHMTITRDAGRSVVTYHHVELDRHGVLIADGMPCESYLDGGNRGQFDAQGIVVPLHPPVADRTPRACAPLITDAALVQPVWQRLAERARAGGHVAPEAEFEPDRAPWLETTDGTRLLPCGDGWRVALPPGCLRVRLRSPSDRPTTLSPWSDDRRRLGVAVSAITLHRGAWRQDLALAGLSGDAGWWPLETAGRLAWRWSDGDGWIDLPEAAEAIEIALHASMAVAVSPDRDRRPVRARAG